MGLASIARACAKIATDTAQAELIFRTYNALPGMPLHGRYFRFQVEEGLQNTGLEEWQQMQNIWSATMSYLNDPDRRQKIIECAKRCWVDLRGMRVTFESSRILALITKPVVAELTFSESLDLQDQTRRIQRREFITLSFLVIIRPRHLFLTPTCFRGWKRRCHPFPLAGPVMGIDPRLSAYRARRSRENTGNATVRRNYSRPI
jgi:hypothetical protein